jgi:uncharacterized lipoprotein YmbA
MMALLLHRAAAAACAIALLAVHGCANTPSTRFYVLTPLAAERPKASPARPGPVVGLRPVELPAELDRPQIVTRVAENTLHLAEFDQWAAPLGENFTRVLAENLARLIPAERVAVLLGAEGVPIDYEVVVDVSRFEGTLGGDCWLVAGWTIFRRGGKAALAAGKASHTGVAGENYAALVAAQSRLVAALGRDIATALETVSPP